MKKLIKIVYIVLLIASPLLSQYIVNVGGLNFTGGVLTALLAYQLLDVINEIWGKKDARKAVYLGFGTKMVLAPILFLIHPFVFRIFLAGEAMNLIQNLLLDIPVFDKLKKVKINFFIRSNLSNIISWTLGSVLFVFLAFYGTKAFGWQLIIGQMLVRYPLTLIYTILTAYLVKRLRK